MSRTLAVLALAFLAIVPRAVSDESQGEGMLNRLLAPGPLMKGHAKLEAKDCLQCHEMGKGIAESKCLGCHKSIQAAVEAKKGFHGLTKEACISCHTDHKGRDQDTTAIDEKAFDHSRTGYKLLGKHAELACAKCHTEKRAAASKVTRSGDLHYLGAKASCVACHRKDDVHHFEGDLAAVDCNQCHGQASWKKDVKFDHGTDTDFPLKGKHASLRCAECHKQPGTAPDDPKTWKWSGLQSECLACHRDYHHFGALKSPKLGDLNRCQTCHGETSWTETHAFNHTVHTRFPVEGKHVGLQCYACHEPKERKPKLFLVPGAPKYHWRELEAKTCQACHDSPHKNDPGSVFKGKKCTQCHVADGWNVIGKNGKGFNHTETRFALTGRHSQISCSSCHVVGRKEVFRFEHADQKFCIDCHKSPHGGQFHEKLATQSCATCHDTVKFANRVDFNHATTAFPLTGKHARVKCEQCHKATEEMFDTKPPRPKAKFLFPELASASCVACHADYHGGQLGKQCASCHDDSGWKQVKFDHDRQSRFAIVGKHMDLKCAQCHKAVPGAAVTFGGKKTPLVHYKPISPECTTCHKDPHAGQYGSRCQECHMEKGWKLTKDFHKSFTLGGIHLTLQCQECHRDNRALAHASRDCALCHQKDDVHQGQLPDCGKCHEQQVWEDVKFKHSLSLFPLRGVHRTLDCAACHAGGVFQGTPSQCIGCHLTDAQASTVHPQPVPSFVNCTTCHNQFVW